jgi:divalent cation transporter
MMNAMLLNLLVGTLVGILVPMAMQRLRLDPAIGSSVLLTFTADSMGFLFSLVWQPSSCLSRKRGRLQDIQVRPSSVPCQSFARPAQIPGTL